MSLSKVAAFLSAFLLTFAAGAGWYYGPRLGGAPAGDCVFIEDLQAAPSTTQPLFDDDNYYSFRFNPTYYANVCEVTVSLRASGSPTGNIEASIRESGASGLPGTIVETSAVTLDASTLTGSAADYTFTFTDVPVQPWALGTEWVLVLYKSTTDASNYVLIDVATTGGWNRDSDDGSAWSSPAQNDGDIGVHANDAYPILLFQEDFETPGYENSWTETDGGGSIDDADTAVAQSGTYSLSFDGANNAHGYWDHSVDLADHYGVARVYVPTAAATSDSLVLSGEDSTTYGAALSWSIAAVKTDASTVTFTATVDGGSGQTATGGIDTWHRVEWHYDEAAGTLDWRLNGTPQTQATGTAAQDWRYTYLGTANAGAGYFDLIQITDVDWIGDNGRGGDAP